MVILDEATAYTDPENEGIIQDSVARLVKGKTLIVIAHRLSTIKDADQIILVNKGTIDQVGTRVVMLICEGVLTTLIITFMIFFFDWRIGIMILCELVIYMLANMLLQNSAKTCAGDKMASGKQLLH